MRAILMAAVLATLFTATALSAEPTPTACDRQAAHPDDPDRRGPGVPQDALDAARAIAACDSDLRAAPSDPRLTYQLGRALLAAGQTERARTLITAAAEAGYAQARFVLGFMHANGTGTAKDPCKAAPLWRDAARQGHLWAEFSFAASALVGDFSACGLDIPAEEIRGYLASARGKAAGSRIAEDVEGLARAVGLP